MTHLDDEQILAAVRSRGAQPGAEDAPEGARHPVGSGPAEPGIERHLADCRDRDHSAIRERMERGVREGDLPTDTPTTELASFYFTVLEGLSLRAKDGATRDQVHAIIDRAMRAWDASTPTVDA